MAKRKYTKWGEKAVAYSCTNKKCKWEGLDYAKLKKPLSRNSWTLVCPDCGNDEFYGLLELPKEND